MDLAGIFILIFFNSLEKFCYVWVCTFWMSFSGDGFFFLILTLFLHIFSINTCLVIFLCNGYEG